MNPTRRTRNASDYAIAHEQVKEGYLKSLQTTLGYNNFIRSSSRSIR
jgi:hypothetical protein